MTEKLFNHYGNRKLINEFCKFKLFSYLSRNYHFRSDFYMNVFHKRSLLIFGSKPQIFHKFDVKKSFV